MERLIISVAGILTAIAAILLCGIPIKKQKEDGTSSGMDAKFIVTVALCYFDIHNSRPDGFGEIIIAAVVTLIVFVLFFYLIYGIMSLLKISGDDVEDRRIKAFWVNAAISIALNFLIYM